MDTTNALAGATVVTDADRLRSLVGEPAPQAARKMRTRLEDVDREWIALSPFCLVATAAADGSCDVSPKGDPAGLALVLDDTTLALPERPGNRRVDGFLNVLANPHVGLLFLLPGRTDTLRVNGRASVVSDAPWFDRMVVKGHRPLLALVVQVEQVFYHCGKAFLRSQLWEPETWQPDAVPSRARIAKRFERSDQPLEEIERYYGAAYTERLYR
jgi:PPOX class probable FMN-dependent enzyme